MAKFTMEIRELISTFGKDEVKSWFLDYDLSDYLTPEEITVINSRGVWNKEQLAITSKWWVQPMPSQIILTRPGVPLVAMAVRTPRSSSQPRNSSTPGMGGRLPSCA